MYDHYPFHKMVVVKIIKKNVWTISRGPVAREHVSHQDITPGTVYPRCVMEKYFKFFVCFVVLESKESPKMNGGHTFVP